MIDRLDEGTESLVRLLTDEGVAEVEVAQSLDSGLEALQETTFDVVLVEPYSAGRGTLTLDVLRKCAPRVPVVVWSDSEAEEAAQEALARGAVEFVSKTPERIPEVPALLQDVAEAWTGIDTTADLAPDSSLPISSPALREPFPRDRAAELASNLRQYAREKGIEGLLVSERAGSCLFSEMPSKVDTKRLASKAALLPHYSRTTGQTMDLEPRSHAMFFQADDGFVTLASAPGHLAVVLLLPSTAAMEEALEHLNTLARLITEIGTRSA